MKDRLLHIEKLRAFSIALVVLFHLEVTGFQNGFLGVDIFFVISGFLMAKLYGDIATVAQLRDYFRRRFARILPAYYATLSLTVVISFFLLLPHEIQMVMKQSIWAVFFLPNIGYWLDTSYFDHTNLRPLLHLWSLGIEMQFYLLFPFILLVARRSKILLLVLAVGSCIEYAVLTQIDPGSAFYLIPGRLWEFLAGFYAAQLMVKLPGRNLPYGSVVGGVALITILLLLLLLPSAGRDYTFVTTLSVVLLTAVVIVMGFSTGAETRPFSKALVALGKYSYSIYLMHFPVIVFVMYSPFGGTNLTPDSPLASLYSVLATFLLAYLLYNFVEVRTRRSLTGRQLGLTALSVCIVTLAIARPVVSLSQQLVDPMLWNLSNALNDKDEFRCAASQETPRSSSESCLIGDLLAPARQVLLVGDSHADAIKATLANYLASTGVGVRLMAQNKAVSHDYPVAGIVAEARRFGIHQIILHSIDNEVRPDAIRELVEAAAAQDMQVVFIESVPRYAFNVPARLLESYRRTHELSVWGERDNPVDFTTQLLAIATQNANFHVFPTLAYFCDAESRCRLSDESGRSYYSDSNHLTHTGAALLLPVFAQLGRL